jgi:hypothetical protein
MTTPTPRGKPRGVCFHKARQTHCVRGHAFDEANTYQYVDKDGGVHRQCRTCRAAARTTTPTGSREQPTHCPHGHAYSRENTYEWVSPAGKTQRACRTCSRQRTREYRARRRASQLSTALDSSAEAA